MNNHLFARHFFPHPRVAVVTRAARRFLIGTVALLCLIMTPCARGAETPAAPDVHEIMRGMRAALDPPRPSLAKIDVVLRDRDGKETRWEAWEGRKPGAQGGRMVMVMTSPAEIAGSAELIAEQPDGPNVEWLYLPTVRRVRKLVPVGGYQPVLGTDFTYADLGFITLHQREVRSLGTDTAPDGTRLYKVEEVLHDPWYYSRIVDWIAADTLLPVRREIYGPANDLWKVEVFESVTRIQGIATPIVIRMEDRYDGGSTELRFLRIRYDAEIPDAVFDPEKLPKLLNDPVWKTTGAN